MISIDIFLTGLMIISTLTGLATEAVKKIFTELKVTYHSNLLAGIVAAILSIGVGVGYTVFSGIAFTSQVITCIIALVFASWLGSMIGYDKIIALLNKNNKKG